MRNLVCMLMAVVMACKSPPNRPPEVNVASDVCGWNKPSNDSDYRTGVCIRNGFALSCVWADGQTYCGASEFKTTCVNLVNAETVCNK